MWRRDARAAVRLEKSQRKSPLRTSPRGLDVFFDDAVMPLICPTCQMSFELVNEFQKMRLNRFDELELSLAKGHSPTKNPAAESPARAV